MEPQVEPEETELPQVELEEAESGQGERWYVEEKSM
jgi:hypothetical protein